MPGLPRLLLLLVVIAIGFAGLPTHADVLPTALVEQDEHRPGVAHHGDAADAECVEVGHCSPVQLLFGAHVGARQVLCRGAWCVSRDVDAASTKPEASIPPPRLV